MKVKLDCGCEYSTYNKRYTKYCPRHFQIVTTNAIIRQKELIQAQMRENKIQEQQLQQERKKQRYYIKPIF